MGLAEAGRLTGSGDLEVDSWFDRDRSADWAMGTAEAGRLTESGPSRRGQWV